MSEWKKVKYDMKEQTIVYRDGYQKVVNVHQVGEKIVQQPVEEIGMANHHQIGDELDIPEMFGIVPLSNWNKGKDKRRVRYE
ncbi:MAG: hypothetical protein II570_06645 [Bacteroidaceae bacterium]|nr:hypothetical protein [Bacteroidaceae bacterium]